MTDPFDVSLRVRLNYEAGGAAKTAIGDIEAMRASAAKLGTATGPSAVAAGIGKVGAEAASAGRAVDEMSRKLGEALKAQRALGGFKSGAELETFLKTFDAQVKTAQTGIGALAASANKLAAGTGPVRLAEGLTGISPAAVEARRHIDDVGTAARAAQRDLDRMGAAHRGAGGGGSGGASGGGGGGHGASGGDGLRGALIAGARPLRMERLVMSAMTPVGLAGLGAGLGLEKMVRGLAEAQGRAIELESAMVEVRRAAGDMPAAGVKHLEGSILDVSRATGAASTELAGVAAAALRAGKPIQELPGFMERAAKTANVMGFSVGVAGDKLIGLSRAWQEDPAGVDDTTDAVALLAQRTGAKAGGVLDFVDQFSNMRERGMSARQVAAFGAGFQTSGLDPSQASSAFGTLSDRLAMPQKAGPEFANRMFSVGIDVNKTRAGMRDDPTRTMMQVLEKLHQIPEEHRANILEQLFGPDGGRDIGRVSEHLDGLKHSLGMVEDVAARNGALERSFKLFDNTTRAKIDRASAAMSTFATKVGQAFSPAVGAGAEALSKTLGAIVDRSDRMEKAATIIGKLRNGVALSAEDNKDIADNPKLRDKLGDFQDDQARAAIRNGPGRPPAELMRPAGPKAPDAEDLAANAEREKNRQAMLAQIQEQEARAKATDSVDDRLRLFDLRRRYRKTFPGVAGSPDDAASSLPHDQHSSLLDPSMIHRASYVAGDDRPGDGASPTDALRAVLSAATKDGVVAGLREVLDMRGGMAAAGGIVNTSFETGSDGGDAYGRVGGDGASAGTGSMRAGAARRAGIRHGGAGMGGRAAHHGGGSADGGGGPSTPLGKTGAKFAGKAPAIMRGLMDRYGLTDEQAAGVLGNLGHESAGFTAYHEGGKASGKGGVGWAQWTGSRRRDFETWTQAHGLNPTSDEASWRYLTEGDPETPGAIAAVKRTHNAHDAVRAFHDRFERSADISHGQIVKPGSWNSRLNYADRALALGAGAAQSASSASTPFQDPAQRREAAARAARPTTPHPSETVSPRFSQGLTSASLRRDEGAGPSAGGARGRQVASSPAPIQNFYGNHDPAQTARMAMLEQNREVRRAQARALHSVGRVA